MVWHQAPLFWCSDCDSAADDHHHPDPLGGKRLERIVSWCRARVGGVKSGVITHYADVFLNSSADRNSSTCPQAGLTTEMAFSPRRLCRFQQAANSKSDTHCLSFFSASFFC